MSKVLRPYGNTCTVELSLPWELAELLVEQGPALIEEIASALRLRKQRTDFHLKASLATDHEQNKRDFYNLGKEVETRLRAHMPNKIDNKLKHHLLAKLAEEYDTEASFLEDVRQLYVKDFKNAQRSKRDAEIVRLYFMGLTNLEIGRKVGASGAWVGKILKKQGDLVAALRRIYVSELSNKGGEK